MPEIIIIVAIARNRVIGRDGRLPWHLPSDLRHFKQTTLDHPIIMGRKTFESIGKPLPRRVNIVLSRVRNLAISGCVCCTTLEEALQYCRENDKVFIIGGGEIFRLALPVTDTIIVTALARDVEGDVLFPLIDDRHFKIVEEQKYLEEEPYSIIRYQRIKQA